MSINEFAFEQALINLGYDTVIDDNKQEML